MSAHKHQLDKISAQKYQSDRISAHKHQFSYLFYLPGGNNFAIKGNENENKPLLFILSTQTGIKKTAKNKTKQTNKQTNKKTKEKTQSKTKKQTKLKN